MTIDIVDHIAADLRNLLASGKMIDVGKGAAEALGLKPTKMYRAVQKIVLDEGHKIYYLPVKQEGTNLQTSMKVLAVANVRFIDVVNNRKNIVRLERLSS